MLPLFTALAELGLPLIAAAVKQKGKEAIEEKLGIELKPDMTAAELKAARDAEIAHEEFLITAAQKEFELEVSDRRDARAMQKAALAQEDLFSKHFNYYLATGCLLFAAVYIFWITFAPIPEKNLRFADTILGFLLGTLVSTIIYFYFGTSRSNKAKDETIAKLTEKKE